MNYNLLWYVWTIWALALVVYGYGWESSLLLWRRYPIVLTVTILTALTSMLLALNKGMMMFKRKETTFRPGGEPLPTAPAPIKEPQAEPQESVGKVTVTASAAPATDTTTTIPDSCLISGDINAAGDIKVNGTVQGKVFSDKTVFVMKNGRVDGEIYANRIEISGTLKGSSRSREMAINAEGFMEGIIECESLSINQQGRFYGTSKPWTEEEKPKAENERIKRVEPLRPTTDILLQETLQTL